MIKNKEMNEIKGKTFSKEDVHLDFNGFIDCKFVECNIIYHGFGPSGLEGCSFEKVRWNFSDAAAKTLNFMSGLYAGGGEGGKKLIEDTIKNIITGQYSKV